MKAWVFSVFLGVLVTATRLANAEVSLLDDNLCSSTPYGPGCPCTTGTPGQCARGFACAGNKTEFDYGTCGGDVDTITCPRDSPDHFIDIWIQNTTSDYCANTQIRTCNDENGCVGVKYRNDTATYLRCPLEYGNPTTGHIANGGLSLPAKLRIGKETKYITFVCDPKPGIQVPLVSEYWPNTGWPKSMPPMGKSNCSHCTGSDYCPWNTVGPGSECECCTRCTPDDGSYPPQYNIMIDNPTQHPWKIQIDVGNSDKDSTCVLRHAFDGPNDLYPTVTSMVNEWRENVDVSDLIQVPPGAVNFTIGIPSNVQQIVAVPLYTTTLSTCVVEALKQYGAPKHIKLTDELPPWCKQNPKGTDCGQDCTVLY